MVLLVHKEGEIMDDQLSSLQTMLEYYRNKCNQLEFEFIQYQIKSETTIRLLKEELAKPENSDGASESTGKSK